MVKPWDEIRDEVIKSIKENYPKEKVDKAMDESLAKASEEVARYKRQLESDPAYQIIKQIKIYPNR